MPYIGQSPATGEANSFKTLDNIASYTLTFDGSSASTVSVANDTITERNHRFVTGQRVTYNDGGGTSITGLSDGVYYIIVEDRHTFKLATNANNAAAGTAINLTGLGVGSSHTLNVAFDGVNTKFKATINNGTRADITSAPQLMLSINGVLQQPHNNTTSPTTGYAVDHTSTIIFSAAPAANDQFFASLVASNFATFDISDNIVDNFTGDGSTTDFTLSKAPPNNESVLVTIDGVVQYPDDTGAVRAYTVSENILTFASAPGSAVEIQVRHIGFAGASTGGISGFYGRTGNAVLKNTDNIVFNNATASGTVQAANVTVTGDLTVNGTTTTLDTELTSVDKLEVDANNTTVAAAITQRGSGDILNLYDGSTEVFTVKDGGNVGIGTDNTVDQLTLGHTNNQLLGFETDNEPTIQSYNAKLHINTVGNDVVFDGTGKVGIGSEIPNSKLEVWNNSNIEVLRLRDTHFNKYLTIRGGGSPNRMIIDSYEGGGGGADIDLASNGSTKVRITSDGKLLLGTTTEGHANAENLTIADTGNCGITIRSGTTSSGFIYFSDATSGTGEYDGYIHYSHNTRDLRFATAATERLRIKSNGNVGIGTDNPEEELSIQLDSSSDGPTLRLRNANGGDGTYTGRISTGDAHGAFFAGINFLKHDTNDGEIRFRTKVAGTNTDVVTIVDGKVGINRTPSHKLEILNGSDALNIVMVRGADATSEYAGMGVDGGNAIITGGSAGNHNVGIVFRTAASGAEAEKVRITSDGKVGVGSDNPGQTLSIAGSSAGLGIYNIGNHHGNVYFFKDGTPKGWLKYRGDNDTLLIGNVTDSIHVKSNGNVGIGDNDPSDKLNVKGNSTTSSGIFIHNANGATNSSADLWFGNWSGATSAAPQARISALNKNVNTAATDLIFEVYTGNTTVERLRITSGGDVGIGTDTVTRGPLHIHEPSTSDCQIHLTNNNTGTTSSDGLTIFAGQSNGDCGFVSRESGGSIEFYTNNSGSVAQRFRILPDGKAYFTGNLGLGGQTSPTSNIHIGDISGGYELRVTANALQFNRSSSSYIDQLHDTGSILFRMGSSYTEAMRITSDGRVSINHNNPNSWAKLTVKQTGADIGGTADTNSNTRGLQLWQDQNDNKSIGLWFTTGGHLSGISGQRSDYSNHWGTDLRFYTHSPDTSNVTQAYERLRITDNGKIGIGHQQVGQITKELTIRPANDGGIRFVRPGASGASVMSHLELTTTTSGSVFPSGEAYTVKYNTINNDQIFTTYTGGGTGGNISFQTGSGSGNETERLRIKSDGVVQVASRLTSDNIQHTPFLLTASDEAVILWQHSQVSYSSSEEAFRISQGSSYLSKSFFFGYNIDGAKGYTFEILGKNVLGRFYLKLYYSDGTDSGNWSINGWNPSSYSTNTITVPTNKKVRGFHLNTSSSTSGYDIYIKEIKIRRISTETNAPNDINIPDPMQFLNVMGGRTGRRTKVHSDRGFRAGGSNAAGMLQLGASAGNVNIDTGIGINASNGGGAMMVLACRNTSNGTQTGAGMYLLNFHYDGNHVPSVTFIGGNNICTFGKTAGNNLTVNCSSGNWSVAGFFGGYGVGNMMV